MNNPSDSIALNTDADRTLSFRRRFDAPLSLVREVYADPTHLDRWWGPEGFSITTHEMDQRPGGHWKFTMHGPDGTDYPNYIRYREVSERGLEYDQGVDEKADWFQGHVRFEEDGDGTYVTMGITFATVEALRETVARSGAADGMHGTQCRLGSLLGELQGKPIGLQITTPDDLSIRMTRTFDAPPELVYQALVDPAILKEWWGPHGYVNDVMESDQRIGGKWRAVQRSPEGDVYSFRGEILALEPPHRIVQTFICEMWPDKVSEESIQLVPDHGKTIAVIRSRFESKADRDAMLESGMEWGASQSYERLDAMLQEQNS